MIDYSNIIIEEGTPVKYDGGVSNEKEVLKFINRIYDKFKRLSVNSKKCFELLNTNVRNNTSFVENLNIFTLSKIRNF